MWPQIILAIGLMVLAYAIQGGTKIPNTTPEAGNLDTPTAEEGGSIPVVFGTVIVNKSNVIWYGDAKTDPIYSDGGGKK